MSADKMNAPTGSLPEAMLRQPDVVGQIGKGIVLPCDALVDAHYEAVRKQLADRPLLILEVGAKYMRLSTESGALLYTRDFESKGTFGPSGILLTAHVFNDIAGTDTPMTNRRAAELAGVSLPASALGNAGTMLRTASQIEHPLVCLGEKQYSGTVLARTYAMAENIVYRPSPHSPPFRAPLPVEVSEIPPIDYKAGVRDLPAEPGADGEGNSEAGTGSSQGDHRAEVAARIIDAYKREFSHSIPAAEMRGGPLDVPEGFTATHAFIHRVLGQGGPKDPETIARIMHRAGIRELHLRSESNIGGVAVSTATIQQAIDEMSSGSATGTFRIISEVDEYGRQVYRRA